MNNETKIISELILILQEYKYKIKNIENDINQKIIYYENIVNNLCNHEWDIDYTYLGEKTQYQCKFCKLYK
jgi:hypothetical protein